MIPFLVVFAPCIAVAVAAWTRIDAETPGVRLVGAALFGVAVGSPISLFVWLPLVALIWRWVA